MTASYRKQFTETLANLFLAEFGSIEDGIQEISSKASISVDTLMKYLSGEDFPSMQTTARLGKSFLVLANDPNANFGFLQLAAAARDEVAEFSSTETSSDTKEVNVNTSNQYTQEPMVEQSEHQVQTQVNDDVYTKIQQLEQQLESYKSQIQTQIEFDQTKNEITDLLTLLNERSKLGIEKGWLPPAVKNKLFENVNEHNAFASFTSICQDKEIDPYVELYAISYALDLFESFGNQMAMFSSTEPEQIDSRQYELEQQIEKQAELNFKLFKQNGAFLVDYPAEITKE